MQALATNPEAWLAAFLFAMLRAGGAFLAAPLFSSIGLPLQVRILLAGAVALAVMGVAPPEPPPLLSAAGLLAAAGEIVIGLSLGFVMQLALAGALVAGEQIAAGAGLGFAAFSDPQSGTPSPVVGQLLSLVALVIFVGIDGHLTLIEMIVRSYGALPPGDAFPATGHIAEVARFGSFVFASGFMIALPVTASLFAVNLSLGILTRAAPQLNIFSVGLPISVAAAMAMLALAFPAIVELLGSAAATGLDQVEAIAGGR